jgi:hypothetical protein
MRPSADSSHSSAGFGIVMTRALVDEPLSTTRHKNEVIFIKYLSS